MGDRKVPAASPPIVEGGTTPRAEDGAVSALPRFAGRWREHAKGRSQGDREDLCVWGCASELGWGLPTHTVDWEGAVPPPRLAARCQSPGRAELGSQKQNAVPTHPTRTRWVTATRAGAGGAIEQSAVAVAQSAIAAAQIGVR